MLYDSALHSIGCDNTCFENLKVVRLAFVFLRPGSNSFLFFFLISVDRFAFALSLSSNSNKIEFWTYIFYFEKKLSK